MVYINYDLKTKKILGAYGQKEICPTPCLEIENEYWHSYSFGTIGLNIDPSTKIITEELEDVRKIKKVELAREYQNERTARNVGIQSAVLNAVIDCRESDVLNMTNVAYLMEKTGTATIDYKCKDNSSKTITLAQLQQVNCELISAQTGFWYKWDGLKKAVDAATTADQVKAITW